MKEELFKIADVLASVIPKDQKDIIDTFKQSIDEKELNVARIISDELVDFYYDINDKSDETLAAKELYNKTMEYYELNY